jgi:hypothetical protein
MIEFSITGDAQVIARLQAMPDKIRAALVNAMKQEWFRIQAAVVTGKLSGDPLHRRTGVLASSINVGGGETASAFEEGDQEIVGRIGTRVRYGKVHEEGGEFNVPAHARHILGRFGAGKAAMTTLVRAHTATFPQRSFLRSTFREMATSVQASLERSVAQAVSE